MRMSRVRVLRQRLIMVAAMLLTLRALAACAPTGAIDVTVINVSGGAVGGVAVSVEGTSLGALTNVSGKALIGSVEPGLRTLRVAGCPGKRNVTVVGGAASQVTLWVCADVVELPYAPNEPMVAMLDIHSDDGLGTKTCEEDVLRPGVGAVHILSNSIPLGACHGAVTIFSQNHALAYSNDASLMPWTDAVGDVHSVSSPGRPLRVPIRFVLSFGATPVDVDVVKKWINDIQLANATLLLRDSYTGIALVGDEAGGDILFDVADAAQAGQIGSGCTSVAAIKANPLIYQPGRLNVYVVPEIELTQSGVNCVAELAQNIIFLNAGSALNFTLLHEIGHALGLLRPQSGHTNGLNGFYEVAEDVPLNVMAGTEQLDSRYFSIGQAARMTLSEDSWVNHPSASDMTTLRQRQSLGGVLPLSVPCGCPETETLPDCPALQTDIERTAMLQTASGETLACGVSVPGPVIVLCPSTTAVNAAFIPALSLGGTRWASLDPSIVTVVPSPSDDKQATLTGQSNGTGRIRTFVDGSFTIFPVTVAGCP
ncbi:MAG: hypothetical protein ABIW79_07495 [Gemmatimonas sp.]